MRNKGTWILFVVVILLSSYAYFGEYKGKEKEKETKDFEAKFFKEIKVEQLNQILLEGTKDRILLNKTPEGWQVIEPVSDSADNEAIESWIKQLADEKSLTIAVQGKDIQWNFFGFDKNLTKLTLSSNLGKSITVEVSEKKNFEGNSFLRIPGEDKIYVGAATWHNHIGKKLFDLRNKRIFRHQISNIQSFSIKNKSNQFSFENKEAKWISPKQSQWLLDQNKVRESIARLNDTVFTEVLVDTKDFDKEKEKYNFLSPEIKIEVSLGDKKWEANVIQTKEKNTILLTNEPRLIVKVDSGFYDKFKQVKLEEYRDARLPFVSFDKSKVKHIGVETKLKKNLFSEESSIWKLSADKVENIEVEQQNIKTMLDKIKDLSVFLYTSDSEFKKNKDLQKITFSDLEKKLIFEIQFTEVFKKKIGDQEKSLRMAKTNLFAEPFYIEDSELEK
ncbi:MAG: DUF4340 domain-containing protein, partial [Bdellovibrionaceae bacterium]|nr:DUF4340 domain-containing protein [Pseudobdellovibrionaceae bacterium]